MNVKTLKKIGIILAFSAVLNSAHSASLIWNVSSGFYNNGSNWSPALQPANGDTTTIDNGGEAFLATTAPSSGNVIVIIGATSTNNDRLTIQTGGILNAVNGSANGLLVGSNGSGTLNINGGGQVNTSGIVAGFNTNGNGTINVNGAGSLLTNTNQPLIISNSSGSGKLNITNGGTVTVGDLFMALSVLSQNASTTINGTNSSLSTLGSQTIGFNGNGVLNIENGGKSTAAGPGGTILTNSPTGNGTLNIIQGTLSTTLLRQGSGTGQVNIEAGTIQALIDQTNFITVRAGINVSAGGCYIDSKSFNIGSSSNFNGTGTLNKLGTGTFTLSGNSNCGGGNVQEGTLIINGSFNGPTNVNSNATLAVNGLLSGLVNNNGLLKGTGTVGSVNNNGKVAPGNSIGILTVTGNFINNSQGILENEINADGQTDLLQVQGSALLNGGTLEVIGAPGNYIPGTQYKIITATGGLSGTFANYINNLPIRSFLTYLPNALVLHLGDPIYNLVGLRGNPLRVADYINSFSGNLISGDFSTVLSTLNTLDPNQLYNALDQLHPAPFQAVAYTAGDTAHLIRERFTDRLNYLRRVSSCKPCYTPCNDRGVWVSGVADFLRQGQTQGLRRFATDTQGISLGYDRHFQDSLVMGLGTGYTHSRIRWGHSYGHVDVNSGFIGAYASQSNCNYYIDGALLGFFNNNRARRHIEFSTIDRRAKSNFYTYGFNPHIGTGLFMDFCSVTVVPYLEFDYYFVQQNRIREHGADSLNLHIKRTFSNLVRLQTGVNFSKYYAFACGTLIPNLSLGYVANRLVGTRKYRSSFNNEPNHFSVYGTDHCFNQFEVGIDVSYLYNDCLGINFAYEAELGKKRREQELNVNINYRF